jgi:tetratricopeptide (TPR) repeat protein
MIALEVDDFGRAEKDYLEALKFAPTDSESLFGLGTVHTRQGNWKAAGEYFEKAGRSLEAEAAALKVAVDELLDSALPEERKTPLVQRRHSQLERIRLAGATSFYSAAAAYLNAGMKDEAVRSAEKSASHPSLKEKSEELLRSIRR